MSFDSSVPAVREQHPTLPAPVPQRTGPSAISQLLFVLFKWRRLILRVAIVLTLAAVIAVTLTPRTYPATAKVLFKPDRAALQISGLPGGRGAPYSPEVVQSEVELLRSRSVLIPVARELLTNEQGGVPRDGLIEATAEALRNSLIATAVPSTNVIQLTYFAASSKEAETTLKLILKHYIQQHAVAYRDAPAVVTFYEQEKDRAADELRRREDSLKQWQELNNTVAVDGEINAQLERWGALQKSRHQTESEIDGTRARLAMLDATASAQPERSIVAQQRVPNPLIAKLRADLADAEVALQGAQKGPLVAKLKAELVTAEIALQDLRQRYTDRDRRVEEKKEQLAMIRQELDTAERQAEADMRQRIADLKRELATAQATAAVAGPEAIGPNPLREGVERDRIVARGQLTALLSQRETLRLQARDVELALAGSRQKKLEADRLSQAVVAARETFVAHGRRLEDSKIAAALDKQQISDLTVIEPPYVLISTTDRLRRILIVVLASIVGVGLGGAIAFSIEFLNNSVRTPDDVEFYVGLPVVATIPVLPDAARLVSGRPSPRRLIGKGSTGSQATAIRRSGAEPS
jgi:uncharacterized protein involved in exopolysaccharide biosynthesis